MRPLLVGALALALACLAGCSPGSAQRAHDLRPTNPAASPRGTPSVAPRPGTSGFGGPRFRPAGSSFISPTTGWVLGSVGCQSCAALWRTTDQGRSWTPLANPSVQLGYAQPSATRVDDVYFANARDGYLYGPGLETTRDGGKTWQRGSLPTVTALAGGAGRAYALVQPHDGPAELLVTRPGSRRWSRLSLPRSTRNLKLAVDGATVALLEPGTDLAVDDPSVRRGKLWISTDAGRRWQTRGVPCNATVDGGAAVISLAFGHPQAVLLDCFSNQQSSQEEHTQHHLFGSKDGGQHWVRLADPTTTGAPVLLADNGAGHAFLTTDGVSDFLDGTLDHAQRWHRVLGSGGSFSGWNDLAFTTTEDGYVVGPTHYAPEHLYLTTNGGQSWKSVRFHVKAAGRRNEPTASAAVRRCTTTQLDITIGPKGGALGTGVALLRAVNISNASCRLDGYPQLQMINRRGIQMATVLAHGRVAAFVDPMPRPIYLGPGRAVTAAIGWMDNAVTLPNGSTDECGTAYSLLVSFRGVNAKRVVPGRGRAYGPYSIRACGNQLTVTDLDHR